MVTGLLAVTLLLNGCSYEELAREVRDYLQLNNEEQVLLKDGDSGAVSARALEDVEQAPAEAVDGLKEEQTQAFHYNRLSEPEQKLYGEILYILQEHLEDIQISTTEPDCLVMSNSGGGEHAAVLLDFGFEFLYFSCIDGDKFFVSQTPFLAVIGLGNTQPCKFTCIYLGSIHACLYILSNEPGMVSPGFSVIILEAFWR